MDHVKVGAHGPRETAERAVYEIIIYSDDIDIGIAKPKRVVFDLRPDMEIGKVVHIEMDSWRADLRLAIDGRIPRGAEILKAAKFNRLAALVRTIDGEPVLSLVAEPPAEAPKLPFRPMLPPRLSGEKEVSIELEVTRKMNADIRSFARVEGYSYREAILRLLDSALTENLG